MSQIKTITVSWFSAGVSSAVATWLMRRTIDHIIYCHIDDQHEDTMRFVKDCEAWFQKPIEILQSPYKNVENALRAQGSTMIRTAYGAGCTRYLKQRVRKTWECEHEWFCRFAYIWGMDLSEKARAERLVDSMKEQTHHFPLIEKGITKEEAHGILANAGIKRPAMYDLGYRNNNCIGCVKGGMWYWNKIRKDFPTVFESRAKLERLMGSTILKQERNDPSLPASAENSVHLYLDALDPNRGREEDEVFAECGAACQAINVGE
jgi:hypothetical protein